RAARAASSDRCGRRRRACGPHGFRVPVSQISAGTYLRVANTARRTTAMDRTRPTTAGEMRVVGDPAFSTNRVPINSDRSAQAQSGTKVAGRVVCEAREARAGTADTAAGDVRDGVVVDTSARLIVQDEPVPGEPDAVEHIGVDGVSHSGKQSDQGM